MNTRTRNKGFQQGLRSVVRMIVAGLVGLTMPPAHANTQVGSPVTVTGVHIYMGTSGGGATGVYVDITPGHPGLEGCTYSAGTELWIEFSTQTSPGGKDLYATVYSAFIAGRTMTFGVSGCGFDGQYP